MKLPKLCSSGEKRKNFKPLIPISWTSIQVILIGLSFIIIGLILSIWGFYLSKTTIKPPSFKTRPGIINDLNYSINKSLSETLKESKATTGKVPTSTTMDYSVYQILQTPKLTTISYLGPCLMGIGCIIIVIIYVVTFEARDRAAKIFPAFLTKARTKAIYDTLIQDTTNQAAQVVALKNATEIINRNKLAAEQQKAQSSQRSSCVISPLLLSKNLLLISGRLLLPGSTFGSTDCPQHKNSLDQIVDIKCETDGINLVETDFTETGKDSFPMQNLEQENSSRISDICGDYFGPFMDESYLLGQNTFPQDINQDEGDERDDLINVHDRQIALRNKNDIINDQTYNNYLSSGENLDKDSISLYSCATLSTPSQITINIIQQHDHTLQIHQNN